MKPQAVLCSWGRTSTIYNTWHDITAPKHCHLTYLQHPGMQKKCSFMKLQELLPFLRKNVRLQKNIVWTLWLCMDFAPRALKLLCENTMKFALPIILLQLECSTNWVNWRRRDFVHVDTCILLKLIEVYSWKRIRPTTGFEFVSATCHLVLPETCVEWWPPWSCQHAQDQLVWS